MGWELLLLTLTLGHFGVKMKEMLEKGDDSPDKHFSLPGDDIFEDNHYTSHELGA